MGKTLIKLLNCLKEGQHLKILVVGIGLEK